MILKANLPHILAVDDDDGIRRLLAQYLSKNGYIVITAEDALTARAILKRYKFDLCILDVMMPGENGIDLAKSITLSYDLPILMLTAMNESEDRIKGLEAGVDDYLPKPFEPKELLLRIKAILRRANSSNQQISSKPMDVLKLDQRSYDPTSKTITNDGGDVIPLTEGESALLYALSQKPNIPVRREMLAAQLNLDDNDRAVDVQMTRLRKKIEPNPSNPSVIITLRGKGYMLKVRGDA